MSAIEQVPEYLQILQDRLAANNNNKAAIARELGVSRPTISLLLAGKYTGGTEKIAAQIISHYTDRTHCPYLNASIHSAKCETTRKASMPVSDPERLRHWTACKDCPHNKEISA